MLLAEAVEPFIGDQSFICGPPLGYGLGITTVPKAEEYAKVVAASTKLEPVPPDKELAEQIITAVMNLLLPSIADEKQVINLLPKYGVKQNIVTLALAAVPPLEVDPTTGTTTTPTTAVTRTIMAKKKIETIVKTTPSIIKPVKASIYKKWWFWAAVATAVIGAGMIVTFTRTTAKA